MFSWSTELAWAGHTEPSNCQATAPTNTLPGVHLVVDTRLLLNAGARQSGYTNSSGTRSVSTHAQAR